MIRRVLLATLACASSMFPAAALAQTCSIQLVNKPKDIISGTATLFTNDPNENGEGEPLVIFSSGGEYSATIGAYSLPTPFSFPAAVANVSISGTIQGADADEACSVTATVNPAPAFTPDDKKKANRLALIFGITTVALGTILTALGCSLTAGALCAFLIGAAAGGGIDTSVFAFIAGDPSDPNFTQIAVPQIPTIPPITPDGFITPASADAANAFLANLAAVGGVGKAAFISANRAQGAHDANATDWETRQVQATQLYTIELAGLLSEQVGIRQTLHDALVANGVFLFATANDVFFFELDLAFFGQLPQPLLDELAIFGADQATINQLTAILIAQDVNAAAGTFPDSLVSPDVISAIQDAATSFSGVGIQIKPGSSSPAPVNPTSSGKIPVAILSSGTFDATTVDPSTVRFGPNGAAGVAGTSLEDVNGDGRLDLVMHFSTKDTGIKCGDQLAVVTGKTSSKELFSGGEPIVTVGCP